MSEEYIKKDDAIAAFELSQYKGIGSGRPSFYTLIKQVQSYSFPDSKNNGDLISRQAVEEMIKVEMPERGMWEIEGDKEKETVCEVCVDLMQKLSDLPSTENKGEWIKYGVPRCGEQHYKCTSCGYYINFGQWGELYTKEFKFCPNCGAKMKGE